MGRSVRCNRGSSIGRSKYGTAVYRSELALRLTGLGYEIERGASGQPDIRGYTPAYLEASSPRRQQIQAHLEQHQRRGAGAAQIAAHQTREAKLDRTHDEVQRAHREMAAAFGDQPARIVREANEHARLREDQSPRITAHTAVTFAKERNLEREAVVDERALLRDALTRSMGDVPFRDIQAAFEQRVAAGEFIGVAQALGAAARAFTTKEMLDLEHDIWAVGILRSLSQVAGVTDIKNAMAGRWTRRVLFGLPAALALLALAGALRIVPPIFGRIVDAATGQPVRGVVVTLGWEWLGSTETVLHSQATTNRWGWFWLMPAIGWSQSLAPLVPTIEGPWLTINQVPADGSGSHAAAEVSALYDPTSKREGTKVSNPAYFPLTVMYDERQTCDVWQQWFATCVDWRTWWNITIPLTPALDTADRCTSVRESVAQDRCRQLNTYRAAFLHVDTFDDVQRDLALCDQLPIDRIRQTCRTQLAAYVVNPNTYGRSAPAADADPRIAQFFPATIAGEHRAPVVCDTTVFTSGHLNCWAKYGQGPSGLIMVTIEEWVGRAEPPLEKRDLLRSEPHYNDATGVVTSDTRHEGTIRMYRGPRVTAADWVSRNRYVRVYSELRTEKQNAFIESFLRSFPSTLH
jgi:hypothetical protein